MSTIMVLEHIPRRTTLEVGALLTVVINVIINVESPFKSWDFWSANKNGSSGNDDLTE